MTCDDINSYYTIGLDFFVECPKYLAKDFLHSVNYLSSVTFSKYFFCRAVFWALVKLCRVSKTLDKENIRQIKNRKKHFFS
jgi:hypothetical protein